MTDPLIDRETLAAAIRPYMTGNPDPDRFAYQAATAVIDSLRLVLTPEVLAEPEWINLTSDYLTKFRPTGGDLHRRIFGGTSNTPR